MDRTPVMLLGERLILRDLEESDIGQDYLRWMQDPGVNRYLESRFAEQSLESLRDFVRSNKKQGALLLAICLKESGRHIGNIKLSPVDPVHHRADIGIIIGDKNEWGKGYATEAVQLLVEHVLRALKIHKLTAGAYAVNEGSVRAFEKAGFKKEALLKSHYLCEGQWVDSWILSRFADSDG